MSKISLRTLLTHGSLLALTFVTTTLAGVQWTGYDPTEIANFFHGISYSVLLLTVLGSHELGHYIAARVHSVDSTLPFFLPFPPYYGLMPFGTLGAVIKIQSEIRTRKALFDIGVSGPIAGFVVSVIVLAIGFATLPSVEYLYNVHPEYRTMSSLPLGGLTFGTSVAYSLLADVFGPTDAFIPPMNELYHYPFLCVGWFGLFVTALNLIPIAQLDGGHITKATLGRRARPVEISALVFLVVLGIAGLMPMFGLPFVTGWPGWLLWAAILAAMNRMSRNRSLVMAFPDDLDSTRQGLALISLLIFIFSFSPTPFII